MGISGRMTQAARLDQTEIGSESTCDGKLRIITIAELPRSLPDAMRKNMAVQSCRLKKPPRPRPQEPR
jgi:hypothetical protein